MAERLRNPFDSPGEDGKNDSSGANADDNDGFIAFSSTPNPNQSANFKPQRGKRNRQDNWRNFGAYERNQQQQQQYYSPRGGHQHNRGSPAGSYFYSTPNWTQQQRGGGPQHYHQRGGRGRGWGGNGTPYGMRGNRGHGGHGGHHHHHRGGGRGGRGRQHHHQQQDNSNRSYFHPSMLEDPWAQFYPKDDQEQLQQHEDGDNPADETASADDSLRPQVGDSFLNPAPDVTLPEDDPDTPAEDSSKYSSFTSATGGDEDKSGDPNDSSDIQRPSFSDSMIPLVGDSILEKNSAQVNDDETV